MARKTLYCWKIRFKELDIFLASSIKGAVRTAIRWADEDISPDEYFKKHFPKTKLLIDESYNLPLIAGINNILSGKDVVKLSVDIFLTAFQWKVLNAIKQIPFGHTETYKQVACRIKNPKAFRAVGQALKRNPLPLIFP